MTGSWSTRSRHQGFARDKEIQSRWVTMTHNSPLIVSKPPHETAVKKGIAVGDGGIRQENSISYQLDM